MLGHGGLHGIGAFMVLFVDHSANDGAFVLIW